MAKDAGAVPDENRPGSEQGRGRKRSGRRAARVGIALLIAALATATFVAYCAFRDGRLCFAGFKLCRCSGPREAHALWVARRHVPREGLLAADARLAAFFSNRRSVLVWEQFDPRRDRPDVIFDTVEALARRKTPDVMGLLVRGEWGCEYLDGTLAVIRRGASRALNAELLAAMRTPVVRFADTRGEGGEDRFLRGRGTVRDWCGRRGSPCRLSRGGSVRLASGAYQAKFFFKVGKQSDKAGRRGDYALWAAEPETCLAGADIVTGQSAGEFQVRALRFTLDQPCQVEPRVTGESAALWLDRVTFEREEPSAGRSVRAGGDFPAATAILAADRNTPRRAVVKSLQQAIRLGDHAEAARLNARLGQEAFERACRVLKAWEDLRHPATGLVPRGLNDARWNGDDVGSDCFPFLLLASHYLDPATEPLWRQTIASERRIGGVLPQVILLPQIEVRELAHQNLLFAGAEYVKDGLLAVSERLGRGPWFDRMEEIAGALVTDAPVETSAGRICASDTEVNGDVLQILPRLYWATRNEAYLRLAERTAEAYLFDVFPKNGNLPALYWDFKAGTPSRGHPHGALVKFRDHGNEIIPGLAEIYFLERKLGRPQAARYRPPLKNFLDQILTLGRTPDGLWYDNVDPRTKKGKQRISDNWGYVALAFQAFDQAEGTNTYASEVQRAMRGAAARKSFEWEGRNPDGYADSIEGMLYFLPWFDLPECREWVDDEIEVLFGKQDPSGFVEGLYLDGNFLRTALLYGMYKTQGVMPDPWRKDLQLGASQDRSSGELTVHVEAASPWSGVLKFDPPRHRTVWNMPVNYARLNSSPEWFAVEADREYEVGNADGRERTVHRGKSLIEGLPLQVEGGRPMRFVVRGRR